MTKNWRLWDNIITIVLLLGAFFSPWMPLQFILVTIVVVFKAILYTKILKKEQNISGMREVFHALYPNRWARAAIVAVLFVVYYMILTGKL